MKFIYVVSYDWASHSHHLLAPCKVQFRGFVLVSSSASP